ncbi:hypothetical protein SBA1_330007 [Candidatus Sulfotelmatobacter kueseliae]|uniref:Uncharacterized protein n=1 Tax=Candidatus Sulfotelmatobacter kueseliae TaxID=2042962 RepID=A0A2U3KMP9_9BACT|nr:hypothetical protein SBA1_330007 [Candidatus Sulfotelmatobacter kueseliae]
MRASAIWSSTRRAKIAVIRGWGWAHCDVVTPRQQLWSQQLELRKTIRPDSAMTEPWH